MKQLSIGEIAGAIAARVTGPGSDIYCRRVSTDTRKIAAGDLFFALAGERFDAHDFIGQAVEKGAAAVVVSRPPDGGLSVPVLLVDDTLAALQRLAAYNRRQFSLPVVAVTGSNGKTTTKDLIAAVLGRRFKTLKTVGNLNNHIGLPLTLLELDGTCGAAVLEMGMRGLGEIDLLAGIAQPNVAVITNIGETHLERLGSIENIAMAKSEVLHHLNPGGAAVLNGDDPWVRKVAGKFNGRVLFYGTGADNDLRAADIMAMDGQTTAFTVYHKDRQAEIKLPVPGRHNVLNALAAVGVGLVAGISMEQAAAGLAGAELTGMRLEILETGSYRIINDAYNANPASTKAALTVLADQAGNRRKVAVLGSMFELGERTESGHREVGAAVFANGVELLVTVGDLAEYIARGAMDKGMTPDKVFHCDDHGRAGEVLRSRLQAGDVILVKGSRGMKMEEIVAGLMS